MLVTILTLLSIIAYVLSLSNSTSQNFEIPETILVTVSGNNTGSEPPCFYEHHEYLEREAIRQYVRRETIQRELRWTQNYMKLFVHGEFLDIPAFRAMSSRIEEQLREVNRLIYRLEPIYADLADWLAHTQDLYERFSDAVELIIYHLLSLRHTLHKSHGLVYLVVRLNVMLLSLTNDFGNPDPKYLNYAKLVLSSKENMRAWKRAFDLLHNVPLDVVQDFEFQYMLATFAIKVLEDHVKRQRLQARVQTFTRSVEDGAVE